MNKQIVKIEIATQNAEGVTTTGLVVHGPSKDWGNLVVWELSQAGIPSGDLVHLAFHKSDGTCVYRWFTW